MRDALKRVRQAASAGPDQDPVGAAAAFDWSEHGDEGGEDSDDDDDEGADADVPPPKPEIDVAALCAMGQREQALAWSAVADQVLAWCEHVHHPPQMLPAEEEAELALLRSCAEAANESSQGHDGCWWADLGGDEQDVAVS